MLILRKVLSALDYWSWPLSFHGLGSGWGLIDKNPNGLKPSPPRLPLLPLLSSNTPNAGTKVLCHSYEKELNNKSTVYWSVKYYQWPTNSFLSGHL